MFQWVTHQSIHGGIVDDVLAIGEISCRNTGEGIVDGVGICGKAPRQKPSEGVIEKSGEEVVN